MPRKNYRRKNYVNVGKTNKTVVTPEELLKKAMDNRVDNDENDYRIYIKGKAVNASEFFGTNLDDYGDKNNNKKEEKEEKKEYQDKVFYTDNIVTDRKGRAKKEKLVLTAEEQSTVMETAANGIISEPLLEKYSLSIFNNDLFLVNEADVTKANIDFNGEGITLYNRDGEFIPNDRKGFIKGMVQYHMKDFFSTYPELGNEKNIIKKLIKNMPIIPYLALQRIDESIGKFESVKRLEYALMFLVPDRDRQLGESKKEYEKNIMEEKIKKLERLGIKDINYSLYKTKNSKYRRKVIEDALKARKNLYATIEGVSFVKETIPLVEEIKQEQTKLLEEEAKKEEIINKLRAFSRGEKVESQENDTKDPIDQAIKNIIAQEEKEQAENQTLNMQEAPNINNEELEKQKQEQELQKQIEAFEKNVQHEFAEMELENEDNYSEEERKMLLGNPGEEKNSSKAKRNIKIFKAIRNSINKKIDKLVINEGIKDRQKVDDKNEKRVLKLFKNYEKENRKLPANIKEEFKYSKKADKKYEREKFLKNAKTNAKYYKLVASEKFKAIGEQFKKIKKLKAESKEGTLKAKVSEGLKKYKKKLIIGAVGVVGLSALGFAAKSLNDQFVSKQNSKEITEKSATLDNSNITIAELDGSSKIFGDLNIKNPFAMKQDEVETENKQENESIVNENQDNKQENESIANENKQEENKTEVDIPNYEQVDIEQGNFEESEVQAPEMVDFENAMIDILDIGIDSKFIMEEGDVNTQANEKGTTGNYKNTGTTEFEVGKIAVVNDDGQVQVFNNGEKLSDIEKEYPGQKTVLAVEDDKNKEYVGWDKVDDVKIALIDSAIYELKDQLDEETMSALIKAKETGLIEKNIVDKIEKIKIKKQQQPQIDIDDYYEL